MLGTGSGSESRREEGGPSLHHVVLNTAHEDVEEGCSRNSRLQLWCSPYWRNGGGLRSSSTGPMKWKEFDPKNENRMISRSRATQVKES